MPEITIDGIKIEVEKGTTVIQAAEQAGIEIPRYCYHPGLSIVGVCRICLVEIERMPKLQVACYTPVTDGMVVHTNNEKVLTARKAVLEFLLVNHPLDCPVCDQAGECWLQNFYMQHGLHDSQMIEDKNKKHKALPIGPNVMLDSERCILCSRCVRFCDEISQTHELGIFNRGDHAELLPYPGRKLDNHYSGNTIDICPVGALTDRDFRFRTRVWYLSETPSVCPGCSTGCNITIHHNDKRVYKAEGHRVSRLKPRYNASVNEWWMCDAGRYGFTFIDAPTRIESPLKKQEAGFESIAWPQAVSEISEKLNQISSTYGAESIGVILSPQMTNEDLYAAKCYFEKLNVQNIDFELVPIEKGYEDDFLIRADKNPNTQGAKNIGLYANKNAGNNVKKMLKLAKDKKLKALYVCYHDLEKGFSKDELEVALKNLDLVVFHGSNENRTSQMADYCLPAATFAEKDGTFTNYNNFIQRINKAVESFGESKPDWLIFRKLAKELGSGLPFFEAEDVFNQMVEDVNHYRNLSYNKIGEHGVQLQTMTSSVEKAEEALQEA